MLSPIDNCGSYLAQAEFPGNGGNIVTFLEESEGTPFACQYII